MKLTSLMNIKNDIFVKKVIITKDNKPLITLDLMKLENEDPGSFDLDFKNFKSWLIGNIIISWFERSDISYVIWSDLSNMQSKVFSVAGEDSQVMTFSNGILIYDPGYENMVYEIPSEIEHELTTDYENIEMIGIDEEFWWGDYTGALERTGRIQDDHLLWTKDARDYDYDMKINKVNVSEQKHPIYTMNEVFTQPESWLDELFRINNLKRTEYLKDRLIAIILVHNAGRIKY